MRIYGRYDRGKEVIRVKFRKRKQKKTKEQKMGHQELRPFQLQFLNVQSQFFAKFEKLLLILGTKIN